MSSTHSAHVPHACVYVPTSDEVNPHTMVPVDRVQPYDYSKHIKGHMQRKLAHRRDQIGAAVAQRLEDSYGLTNVGGPVVETYTPSIGFHSDSATHASEASTNYSSFRIPRPPSSATPHRPKVSAARTRPSSAIYSPVASPVAKLTSGAVRPVSPSRSLTQLRPRSSPLRGRYSLGDETVTSPRHSFAVSARAEGTESHPDIHHNSEMCERNDGGDELVSNSRDDTSGYVRYDYGKARSSPRATPAGGNSTLNSQTGDRGAKVNHSTEAAPLPFPELNTRPTEGQVAAAVELLRQRASNAHVPFVSGGGAVTYSTSSQGGYGIVNNSGRHANHYPQKSRPSTAGATQNLSSRAGDTHSSWAGDTAAGPQLTPRTNVLTVRTMSDTLHAGKVQKSTSTEEAKTQQHRPLVGTAVESSPRRHSLANGLTRSQSARAVSAHTAKQREVEEQKELERIAAATVRMQSDHEHRKAMRQRRYLQGLALQQPFEVAQFRRVVAAEWRGVEAQRTQDVVDDIPSQVSVQRRLNGGDRVDRRDQTVLVARAVESAHHARFVRQLRKPQTNYFPRRDLL